MIQKWEKDFRNLFIPANLGKEIDSPPPTTFLEESGLLEGGGRARASCPRRVGTHVGQRGRLRRDPYLSSSVSCHH